MNRFLQPASVALIGVSSRPNTLSALLLKNLREGGYPGDVYLVNPRGGEIDGLPCRLSVGDLPSTVDLALVIVPAAQVEETVRACANRGIQRALVISAGFKETGDAGREREQRITQLARTTGLRLIGPNSMGLMNLDPSVRLNATFSPAAAVPGSVAFITQSGALGVAVLSMASQWRLGFSQFVSLGNECDVTAAELLERCVSDPVTRVVVLYMESLAHGRDLLEIGRRLAAEKPIVLLHSGRTEAGAAAAASHTGALATRPGVAEGVFERAGFLVATSLEHMLEMAVAFSRGLIPAAPARSFAVLTNAGGPAVLATDTAVSEGLRLATLNTDTVVELLRCTPPEASVRNPVDLLPAAGNELFLCSAGKLLADRSVEQLLVLKVNSPLGSGEPVLLDGLNRLQQQYDKPVSAALMMPPDNFDWSGGAGVPAFWFPEAAARSAVALSRYAEIRLEHRAPAAGARWIPPEAVRLLCRPSGIRHLPQANVFRLLELYGVTCAPFLVAATFEQAASFAEICGYPVVLKSASPDIVHKTEAGGVLLDIRGEEALAAAFSRLPGASTHGVLVQKYVRGRHRELLAGYVRDPRLGPLLAFGVGGTLVEAVAAVDYLALPAGEDELRRLIERSRAADALGPIRGWEPVNIQRVIDALLGLAHLGLNHPEIASVEINPLLAGSGAEETLAVDARLAFV